MQNNLNDLPIALAGKIATDFFESKVVLDRDEVAFKLKNLLSDYSIVDIHFLTLKNLVECVCLLKGIDYEKEYKATGIADLFTVKNYEFSKIDDKLLVIDFDKSQVHDSTVTILTEVCKNLTTDKSKYLLRFEIIKGGGYRYFIQKNKEDVYICFYTNLYDGEIYVRRFMSIKPDLSSGAPEILKAGRKFVTKHKYTIKVPYFDGFFLNEIERVIKTLEEYEDTKLA